MKKFPILFDVVEIIQYQKKIKTKEEKKEYLLFLREEFSDICYYYTDNGIEKYLVEHKLTDKYKPEKYNQSTDFDRTHISKSKYRRFLRDLEKILDYIQDQMVDNYLEEKRKENKIYRDYKTFNYDVQKVLDYSNELGKDNKNYLAWILNNYFHSTIKKMNKGMPIPENDGKYISAATVILNSEFFIKIKYRLELLQNNPNLKIFNSYTKAVEDLKKMKLKDISARNKDLCEFNFDKIKERANNIKDLNERLLYLLRVKKEETQIKGIIKKDFLGLSFEEKLNAEIEYAKEEIRIKSNNNIITENNERKQATENVTIKTNEEYEKEIEYLRNKIITPKRYDIPELAEYYLKVAKKVRTKPSLRELEKGSEYNKDKWQKKIYNDVEFVMSLIGKLEKEKDKLSDKLYEELFKVWTKKLSDIQTKDKNNRNKSKAKEYKENIGSDED